MQTPEVDSPTDNRRPQPSQQNPAKPGKRGRKTTVRPSGGPPDNPTVDDSGGFNSEDGGGVHADALEGPEPGPRELPVSTRTRDRPRGSDRRTKPAIGTTPRQGRRSKPQGADDDKHRDNGERPAMLSETRLAELETEIRASVDGLALALLDAIARKIRLGEQLAEAKACCEAVRGEWTRVLERCKIKKRTAREAIQFSRERQAIERMRHDDADLKVADIRLALSIPKSRPVAPSHSVDAPSAARSALPAPAIERSDVEIDDEPDQLPPSIGHEDRIPGTAVVSRQEPRPGPPILDDRTDPKAPTETSGVDDGRGDLALSLIRRLSWEVRRLELTTRQVNVGQWRRDVEKIKTSLADLTTAIERIQADLEVRLEPGR